MDLYIIFVFIYLLMLVKFLVCIASYVESNFEQVSSLLIPDDNPTLIVRTTSLVN